MKKNINIRNFIIVLLCITVICMGIGFVVLAAKLEYEKNRQDEFNVEFTKIEAATSIKGGITDPVATKQIINDGKTVDFSFTMNAPNDELAYYLTIKNTGTLPAKIIKLISSPNYITNQSSASLIYPVTITQEKLENKVLKPNQEVKIKLVVSYNMSNTQKQILIPYQLSILATKEN